MDLIHNLSFPFKETTTMTDVSQDKQSTSLQIREFRLFLENAYLPLSHHLQTLQSVQSVKTSAISVAKTYGAIDLKKTTFWLLVKVSQGK